MSTLVDESVIEKVSKIRETEENNFLEKLSDAEKKSIHKGIADADAGRVKSQEEVHKLFKKSQ